jgi:hypothetical protein
MWFVALFRLILDIVPISANEADRVFRHISEPLVMAGAFVADCCRRA